MQHQVDLWGEAFHCGLLGGLYLFARVVHDNSTELAEVGDADGGGGF